MPARSRLARVNAGRASFRPTGVMTTSATSIDAASRSTPARPPS
jgi:hypothetical protein